MVAVYWVLAARLAAGVKVAVLPLTLTVPVTAAPPVVVFKVKVVVFSVEFVIGTEKVADTEVLSATPVALLAGLVEDTVGGVGAAGELLLLPPPPQAARTSDATTQSVPALKRASRFMT
jgi:hypothetical protein